MNRPLWLGLLGLVLIAVVWIASMGDGAIAAQSGELITHISVASDGTPGDFSSFDAVLSADGRFVAFESYASNLAPNDTNDWRDIFVHDRQTGETTRISVGSDGTQGNTNSEDPDISGDGRFITFSSEAPNLVANDTNGSEDVFLHDRETGETARISVRSDGTQGDGDSFAGAISADGRFIVFQSRAQNLIPLDTNDRTDIFLHDRSTHETIAVSVNESGALIGGAAPAISADGHVTVFISGVSNDDANIYTYNRLTNQLRLVPGTWGGYYSDVSSENKPALSADGRFVAFGSETSTLVAGDTNNREDIFVYDQQTGSMERVSVGSNGQQANDYSLQPALSDDGQLVAFTSYASNLMSNRPPGGSVGAYVRNRQTGTTTHVSVFADGSEASGEDPDFSADGHLVVFESYMSLVPDDTPGAEDVFVYDRGVSIPGTPTRTPSPTPTGTPTPTPSPTPRPVAVLVHGWQGLSPTGGYDCSQGAAEYPEAATGFDDLAQELLDKHYRVYFAHWTTGHVLDKPTMRIEQAAKCLQEQLAVIRHEAEVERVTLVAHSMGGLVSRAYLEDATGLYQDDVEQLITYGSPHSGINMGVILKLLGLRYLGVWDTFHICKNNPGTCQLSTLGVALVNHRYQPRGVMDYDLIGGDGGMKGDGIWWAFDQALLGTEGPHDGIIGQRSAWGQGVFTGIQGSRISRWSVTGESHMVWLGEPNYFEGAASTNCLRHVLDLVEDAPCTPAPETRTSQHQDEIPLSYTPTLSGTLSSGQAQTLALKLSASESHILVSWNRGDVSLALRAPDGTIVSPSTASEVGGRYGKDSEWIPMAAYHFTSTIPGTWQATITATAVTTSTDFVLFGAELSPTTLVVDQPSSVAHSAPFPLTARLAEGSTPLAGATVNATLFGPGGPVHATLGETTSGTYAAQITAPTEPGQYHVIVRASGASFERQEDFLLMVRPSDVIRRSAPTIQALDTDSNGRYNTLRVTLPVTVNHATPYIAGATLRAPDGTVITEARVETAWATGAQNLVLNFDGVAIGQAGKNGPYRVDLMLVAADTIQLVLDETPLVQTQGYQASEFESRRYLYLPLLRR